MSDYLLRGLSSSKKSRAFEDYTIYKYNQMNFMLNLTLITTK